MKLFISLALCYLLQQVGSQTLFQTKSPYYPMVDSEQIYFTDNRPAPVNTYNVVAQNTEQQRHRGIIAQGSTTNGQISPLGPNFDVNILKRPDVDLQPPYEKEYAHDDGVAHRQSAADQLTVTDTGKSLKFDNVSLALTSFGINVMKNVIDLQAGNTVVSPYSIASLLSLLQQGAAGPTLEQISAALQMAPVTSASAFKKLTDDLQKRSSRNILRVANNIFIADAFDVNRQFKQIAVRNFGSDLTPFSFANPERASQTINNWVASKTNNKINKLVTPESINENSQLVMVNAVYFKGLWEIRFRPEATRDHDFFLSNGATKAVPFMRMRRYFRTGIDRSIKSQIIILPFENDQYSLMIILPLQVTNIPAVLSSLTVSQLASYHNFTAMETELLLPKFTIKADTDLTSVLKKMGITKMFSQYSELTGLGTYGTFSPQVSSALHSALLSIDEDGGSAAAATAFAVVALSYDDPSVTFKANRPFLAILWDNQSAVPLFMAKIEDPSL